MIVENDEQLYESGSYELPQELTNVEVEVPVIKQEKTFNDLDPYDKIRLAAAQYGLALKNPEKNCKKCYGRGYISINTGNNIPNACTCIFQKQDRHRVLNNLAAPNRTQRRAMEYSKRK